MNNYLFYNPISQGFDALCHQLVTASNAGSVSSYLTTLVIVAVNISIRYSLKFLVNFERLENTTHEVISYSMKLFICQYINTALLTLFIYNNLSYFNNSLTHFVTSTGFIFGFLAGPYSDFDVNWYMAVGASFTFTMLLYTIGNFKHLGFFVTHRFAREFYTLRSSSDKGLGRNSLG